MYLEKSSGCSLEHREYVAEEECRLFVEPSAAFVRGMESGSGQGRGNGENFKGEADAALAEAKSWFAQAMLEGDTSKGLLARAMLN